MLRIRGLAVGGTRAALRRYKSSIVRDIDRSIAADTPHVYDGEDQDLFRATQAPNRKDTWAPSQRPRDEAMVGVRFDGKDLSTQPRPYAAIDLIAEIPIKYVDHMAVCDGNADSQHGGVQGHPKIFINVDKPGSHACLYCGNRYADFSQREAIETGRAQ